MALGQAFAIRLLSQGEHATRVMFERRALLTHFCRPALAAELDVAAGQTQNKLGKSCSDMDKWSAIWTTLLILFHSAATHCRYRAETMTLWRHLNSSATAQWVSSKPQAKRTLIADFAARRRPRLSSREQLWIASALLAAVQPSPWLQPATSKPSSTIDETHRLDKTTGQPPKTNKRIQMKQPSNSVRGGQVNRWRYVCFWP